MFLKAQDLYDQTRGGLDVILAWCPGAQAAYERKKTHFQFDEFDTKASCTLREHGGLWWVKNFGEDWPSMKAIDFVMRRENSAFVDAIRMIAERLQLQGDDPEQKTKPGFEYRWEKPEPDQKEKWYHVEFKDFTMPELKSIFALNAWGYLCGRGAARSEEKGFDQAVALCQKYNLYSVASYSWVSRHEESGQIRKHIIRSTDSYPIFCYDEDAFKKLYQPKAKDEKDRFRYFGTKPEKFLHGLSLHQKICAVATAELDKCTQEGKQAPSHLKTRYDELILCSGGSDAMNVAAMGFPVVWKNSETDPLEEEQYKELKKLCRHVYLLFDNDSKGREQSLKLALLYLQLRTIYLPEFKDDGDRDWRGKKYKDVRDFFVKYRRDDFRNLLRNAYPLQFWDQDVQTNRKGEPVIVDGEEVYKYRLLPTLIRNFLFRNGFARMIIGTDEQGTRLWEYVRVVGNVVKRVTTEEVRSFAHGFLEERCLDWRLRDSLSNSTVLTDQQLALLPEIELEFEDYDARTQYLFFRNAVWKVTKDGIEESKAKDSTRYVWANEVIDHHVKKLDPAFELVVDEHDQVRVKILNAQCLFLRYLINASRVYWRKELETECDKLTAEAQKLYRRENLFTLEGSLLSEEEQQEQMQHLAAKVSAFGYCLHRYKNKANAFAIWSMDYVMDDPEKSSGGTGKSMSAGALEYMMPVHVLNGRNEDEIKDRFKFEGVTKHTDLVWLDDAHKTTPFDEFFSLITNFMTIPRKGQRTLRLAFPEAPKLYITSNFTPTKIDNSTFRRLWFTAYSDYYHVNPTGQFRERRRPFDEFGKQLFDDFTPDEWNYFFNFMAQCVVAWLRHSRIDPPMDNLLINTYRQKVGKEFMEWADTYFSPESGRLNTYWPRYKTYESYKGEVKNYASARAFKEKLEMWSLYQGYSLNPVNAEGYRADGKRITIKEVKEIWNSREGRWHRPDGVEEDSVEFFYIQIPGEEMLRYDLATIRRPESPKGDGLPF